MKIAILITLLVAAGAANANELLCTDTVMQDDFSVLDNGLVSIEADQASGDFTGEFELHGDVQVRYQDRIMRAGHIIFNQSNDKVIATNTIEYQDDSILVTGESGVVDIASDSARVEAASYSLATRRAHGTADSLYKLDTKSHLNRITYSTCDEDDLDWQLHARKLTLDHEEGFGSGRDIWIEFMGVPILYTPWASFPIDDRRKTGVLLPKFGRSSKHGTDIALPYYLNLAPNYDATITPRYMSRDGTMLGLELRWLTKYLEQTAEGEWLPESAIHGEADDDRYRYRVKQHGQWGKYLQYHADFHGASDDHFIDYFDIDLAGQSRTYISKDAALSFRSENVTAKLESRKFQLIDDDFDRPYDILPHALLSSQYYLNDQLSLAGTVRHSEFQHPTKTDGSRSVLEASLNYSYEENGIVLEPSATLFGRAYTLRDEIDDTQTYSQVVYQFHHAITLEKPPTQPGGLLHQITPHFYYVYSEYDNQDDIPIFDTSARELAFHNFSSPNRFISYDRIADLNELRIYIDSQWRDIDTGLQRAQFRIGQIVRFETPEVTLEGTDTRTHSNVIQDVSLALSESWTASQFWEWNTYEDITQRFRLGLQYRPQQGRVFNLGYVKERGTEEQAQLSFGYDIDSQWSVLGRAHYSIFNEQLIETLAGFEYQSCCWSLRTIWQRQREDFDSDLQNGIYFQIEFKGLTELGRNIDGLLERKIPGY